jgi:hypothetical protein
LAWGEPILVVGTVNLLLLYQKYFLYMKDHKKMARMAMAMAMAIRISR